MSQLDKDFAAKARAASGQIVAGRMDKPGFYTPNGATSTMDTNQMRAQNRLAAGRAWASNPIRLGVGEIMPERAGRPSTPNFTMRGAVPAGQQLVPSDGFDPSMRGKTSPLPEPKPSLFDRAKVGVKGLASAVRPVGGAEEVGRGLGRAVATVIPKQVGVGGMLGAAAVGAQGLAMDHDGMRSKFYDDPSVGVGDKITQGLRDVKTLALPAASGIVGSVAGAPAGPVGMIGGGAGGGIIGGAADRYIEGMLGESALDRYRAAQKQTPAAPAAPAKVAEEQPKVAETTQPTQSPWTRASTLEDEAKRQITNSAPIQDGGNGLLAQAEAGFKRLRGQYEQGGDGGARAFRDPATQAAFNAMQMLNGSGISVATTKDGRTEFSGDNRAGGGQLYRAADGSLTTDWSKTKNYAEAIERNAKDQDRLAEMTRGAALSGDREAVARLTAGDGRLAAIAAEAGGERDLRQRAKDGSRSATAALAEMARAQADSAYKAQDLDLRRQALQATINDQNLDREVKAGMLGLQNAKAWYEINKDARKEATDATTRTDGMIKDVSTVDGKLDPNLLQQNRAAAARLKRGRDESDPSYVTDVMETANLQRGLGEGQWFIDRLFSQPNGSDPQKWRVNKGSLRGGYVTDDGKHIADWQLNRMSPELKRRFLNDFVVKEDK